MKLEALLKVLIVVFVIIAAGLGYVLYSKNGGKLSTLVQMTTSTPVTGGTPSSSAEETSQPVDFSKNKALQTPGPNSTADEQKAFFDYIVSIAKEQSNISVGASCVVTPVAVKITEGGSGLTITNSDKVDHTLTFNPDNVYTLKPGEKTKVTGVFKKGGGIYGFGCDSTSGAVGIILVQPQL